jgi:hypothetical protein
MKTPCEGCKREFTSEKNFKLHRKSCKPYKDYLSDLLSQKCVLEDAAEASRATQRARVAEAAQAGTHVDDEVSD